eukprot:391009-Amphidinium_carterae.1
MTSATAVVQTGTSLRKRTGEPLEDGHRTLDYSQVMSPTRQKRSICKDYSNSGLHAPNTQELM